jgi:2'-5' RNA ligase
MAVVAFPMLDQADLEWIESIRVVHDPQAGRIPPHFTLVFPVDTSAAGIESELARVVPFHQPITFVVRTAVAVPDSVHGGGHVFVVPDEGRDAIARLHDEVYAGILRPHLRDDIAFVPHVTVAAHADVRWCETFAKQLNATLQPVSGVVESLTLVDVSATKIESVARFTLGTR